ncbi:glycosyltransferase [Rhizobium sp. CC-YZS058]|uniref:glycosyltransferase n=1 Tax=Rhizobium sp. CC-YZS058 TaxID=3042153 RepID=UPI002B05CEB3|nr:glycosyltransferase [Rhizobium sp. CC-YZS058]MEA3534686.1 glycosyltransferase [Rhizobium sp. CC-YZS058]
MVLALSLATGILLLVHLISLLIASLRLARGGTPAPAVGEAPPVSIVIPENGIEPYSEETIARAFRLDWPHYELIFCLADPKDPLIPTIRAAMAAQPDRPAQILTGDDRISANPKLNNCVKGWLAARHDWVILADSNVLMPQDYIRHLMAAWRPNTGLVCSTPIGARPHGFWAEVECMFLNSHQARWQYAGEALGWGFAQGKSMLWHKPMLDANGGIHALGAEIAEDAASTKLVSRLGLKVHLVSAPFSQPLGARTLNEVWSRQRRWARLRRVTFPAFFVPEIILGAVPPLALTLAACWLSGTAPLLPVLAILLAIYLPELALARAKCWRLSALSLPAMITRDLLLPLVWLKSWQTTAFAWRGNSMTIGTKGTELREA